MSDFEIELVDVSGAADHDRSFDQPNLPHRSGLYCYLVPLRPLRIDYPKAFEEQNAVAAHGHLIQSSERPCCRILAPRAQPISSRCARYLVVAECDPFKHS